MLVGTVLVGDRLAEANVLVGEIADAVATCVLIFLG